MIEVGSLALLCDSLGSISQVLRNSFGARISLRIGMPFARLAASGSLSKALSFMAEINASGTAFDWEVNIPAGEQVISLHFTGGKRGEQILVVGSENGRSALHLYEELLGKGNQPALPPPLVQEEQVEDERSSPDENQFNEISRLNNELVTMQRELARKNAELARLNDLKNQFLGMAAHDLRNPLQGILSCSEFLITETAGKLDPSQAGFLILIRDQSKYMSNLVNDLLDVSAIESGNLQLDLQPVDLLSLAQTNLARNRLIAARNNITIDLHADPVPLVPLDPAKMEQVLDNLLTNAIKFSPPGTIIRITIGCSEPGILIQVQDQGPGIPPEQIARLFQPFQRGKKGTRGERSTGLGLSIVKRIVEGHGGKIWLESQPGTGTTFFISIPSRPSEVRK